MIKINNQLQIFKNEQLNLQVRTIQNDDGSISVNAEDAARGFGWVDNSQRATNGSQLSKVRWARINGYIKEFGFSQDIAKDDYIPESLFYMLGMKASNKVAQEFQKWLAIDVIPSIRKTGSYSSNGIIKQLIEQLNNTNSRLQELENIVYKKQIQSIANRKHYLKLNEPLEVRLDRITSDMINQIIANSIVDGILRRTEEGIVVDKNVLFFEASKFNIKKHDIKKKLELLNKIIYKQVRINGKNMWCIVINK
ncbi:hypothetical protein [Clostridium botulinum]|uniref:BRO-N domain-containing protein n=1 Tax=Clostridium botulinum TaxID=1491 RepID=UPI0013FFC2E6|nr:hypothetical protein [Clostridium botulinum]MBY6915372.1 hypothetical protein [Clostridium botulinum]NFQ37728.1 hypothetical protein [Clostridium botulinum]